MQKYNKHENIFKYYKKSLCAEAAEDGPKPVKEMGVVYRFSLGVGSRKVRVIPVIVWSVVLLGADNIATLEWEAKFRSKVEHTF